MTGNPLLIRNSLSNRQMAHGLVRMGDRSRVNIDAEHRRTGEMLMILTEWEVQFS
jgi:hypothetical protein